MMDWILLMFAGGPITGLLDGEFETAIIYCAIQATALLITYFLRKKRIVTSGSPLKHYILALIIGHVVYVIRKLILLIIFFSCWPIIVILDGNFEIFCFYCAIQATALLITYFLRKKGVVTSGSPLRHYILGFIIGHIIYVVICVCIFAWSLSHGTLIWGFSDKTDSPELGFLTKSQFYSESHNSSFLSRLLL